MMVTSSAPRIFSFSSKIFSCVRHLNTLKNQPVYCSAPQNYVFVRRTSTLPEKPPFESLPIFAKFGKDIMNFYKFPSIVYCNWIVNVKWYILPVLCTVAFAMERTATAGELDEETFNAYVALMAFIYSKCLLVGLPFRNFISHIFITPEEDVVLSYLNFYGSRVDEKFPKGDLYLKSRETGPLKLITRDIFYVFLISRSTGRKFRINFKHCDMFDEDLFTSHFGRIPATAVKS